ncbi:MAG TPA: succinate dehydrogenase, hydrophobic membrane anchor protein [Gammaproteobacteria bacterium]|nr:succinate dehydrogenase, hydrophobic membrane anchor protein [Gammaproteobacteria bacterium]
MSDLRTPLSAARSWGSGHNGTRHWIAQRLTALALIPLGLAAVILFFWVMHLGYAQAVAVMHEPWVLLFVVLLVGVMYWHGFLGLQMIIEDYVPNHRRAFIVITLVRFAAVALGLLGVISAALVAFRSF